MHQQYSFKSLRWKADASQILSLDNSIFSHLSFSLKFQSVLAGRWVLPNWWGSPMLLGIARLYSEKTTLLWATLGHPETLLRVDNSTLGYSWAPTDSTQSGLLYSWTSSDSTQAHWTCFFSWHHFWGEILWTLCPDVANSCCKQPKWNMIEFFCRK